MPGYILLLVVNVSIHFPIVDTRLLYSKQMRLASPTWPIAALDKHFVRNFGIVRKRLRGGNMYWRGEDRFCQANRIIKFEQNKIAEFNHIIKPTYRRFYSDGKFMNKFDLGFTVEKSFLLPSIPDDINILEKIFSVVVSVKYEKKRVPLVKCGKHLANAFRKASTRSDEIKNVSSTSVTSRNPIGIVTYKEGELDLNFNNRFTEIRIDNTKHLQVANYIKIHFGSVKIEDVLLPIWLICIPNFAPKQFMPSKPNSGKLKSLRSRIFKIDAGKLRNQLKDCNVEINKIIGLQSTQDKEKLNSLKQKALKIKTELKQAYVEQRKMFNEFDNVRFRKTIIETGLFLSKNEEKSLYDAIRYLRLLLSRIHVEKETLFYLLTLIKSEKEVSFFGKPYIKNYLTELSNMIFKEQHCNISMYNLLDYTLQLSEEILNEEWAFLKEETRFFLNDIINENKERFYSLFYTDNNTTINGHVNQTGMNSNVKASYNTIEENKISQGGIDSISSVKGTVEKENNLLNDLLDKAIRITERNSNTIKLEDLHNDDFVHWLRDKGYYVTDQTRSGRSLLSVGEVDIMIRTENGTPLSIIEAFRLQSCSAQNSIIASHLNKLLKDYDTSGLSKNYILVYAENSDFSALWNSYVNYIEKINDKPNFTTNHQLKSFEDVLSKTVVIGPVITVMLGQQKRESLGQKDWRYYGGHWAKNSLLIVRSKRRLLGQNASVVPF